MSLVARTIARPAVARVCLALLGILALVLLAQTWRRAHRVDGNDFTSYLLAAQAIAAAHPLDAIRTPFPYIYPLFLAFALVPLTVLPYGVSVVLWFALNASSLVLSFILLERWRSAPDTLPADATRHGAPAPAALATGAGALPLATIVGLVFIDVIQNDLLNGQVNLLVLGACVLALHALLAGRDTGASASWAVASAIKLVPLALTPFFIRRRAWRTLIAGLCLAALLCVLPAIVMGVEPMMDWYAAYVRSFIAPSLIDSADVALDFSIYGMLASMAPALHAVPAGRLVTALACLAAIALIDGRRAVSRQATLSVFSLSLLAIPLVSPKSETHHLVFAIPAACLLASTSLHDRSSGARVRRALLIAAAALYWVGHQVDPMKSVAWFTGLVILAGLTIAQAGRVRDGADRHPERV